MKKIILAVAIIIAMVACTQKPADGFVINGTLKGNAENAEVKLYDGMGGYPYKEAMDSTFVKNGKFQFKGKLDRPMQVLVRIIMPDSTLELFDRELGGSFYLDNSTVTFDADVNTVTSTYYYPPRKVAPVITGSAIQVENERLSAMISDINAKMESLGETRIEIYNKLDEDANATQLNGEDIFDLGVRLQTEMETLSQKKDEIINKFIKENPQSAVAFDNAVYMFFDGHLSAQQIDDLLATLEPAWKGTTRFEELLDEAENFKKMAIGQILPDAEFLNEKGETVLLSSVLPKDDYAMVEFWASWCGPCRGEIPHLKKLKERFPHFNIISISIDEDSEAWKKALKEEKMNWLQLNESNGYNGVITTKYNISGVPACFIIDKDRRIIQSDSRGIKLDKFVFETYGKKQ